MAKSKKAMGVQQCLLTPEKDLKSILEYLCEESNKLHNCAVYYARQIWFKARRFVTGFDLVNEMNRNSHFRAMASEVSVQTCLSVGESITSFATLLKKSINEGLEQKPRFPGYRKPGFHLIAFPKRALKLVDGQIRFPR
jgi:hypothetical protein